MRIEVEKRYKESFDIMLEILLKYPCTTIEELKENILTTYSVNEEIINELIYYLLSKNCLEIVEPSKNFEKSKIKLIETIEIELVDDRIGGNYPKILLSYPPYNIFGLETEFKQLDFPINTLKEGFQELFESASHTIYICSPFIEYNGFDIYLPTLLSKAKSGVDIKIIARQISITDPDSRYEQIKRIQKTFEEKNALVSIRDYHFSTEQGIESSIHAKMIVCDYEYAYVGSGELRKNSFDKNFEAGIVLKGEKAFQLGIIFDRLFSVSASIDVSGYKK